MCLVHFCACFEQPSAHHQENQLYQYIIWYISLCIGGRLVCRSETCVPDGHLRRVIYTRWCIDTIESPDDEHWVARNMHRSELNTLKTCVNLVINKKRTVTLHVSWMGTSEEQRIAAVVLCTELALPVVPKVYGTLRWVYVEIYGIVAIRPNESQ